MGPRIIPNESMLLKRPIPIPSLPSGMKLTASVACEVVIREKLMPCSRRTPMNSETVAAMNVTGKRIAQQAVAIKRTRLQSIISDIIPENGRAASATRGNTARQIPMIEFLQCKTSIK